MYGQPEWPPSPLRILQALVAGSAGFWNERRNLVHAAPALRWLESLPHPKIVAAEASPSYVPYRLYVPDNVGDKVARAWSRGSEASIAEYRAEKDVRPIRLYGDAVHYLYQLDESSESHSEVLSAAAQAVTHVGWGRDVATGECRVITEDESTRLAGVRWSPSGGGGVKLRVPRKGTLDDLQRHHTDFLNRMSDDIFRPVPPLRAFDVVSYRRDDELTGPPWRAFDLVNAEGSRYRYPHRRLIHIAGMVRHVAIREMRCYPPEGLGTDWVESFVAGHAVPNTPHRQISYLPLPSLGHEHADPGIRRVMIAAPVGDEALLDYVARRLSGKRLEPEGNEFSGREAPLLFPIERGGGGGVIGKYTDAANEWHSFTPVILPGHDDHKPDKTRSLIERALRQSGVEQECEFEWSAYSRFARSWSAHKYDKEKRPQGYFRPSYLAALTAVHLTLRFRLGVKVPGPLVIGAGRHCGFGLMAQL